MTSDSEDDEELVKFSLAVDPTFECQQPDSERADRKSKKSQLPAGAETRERIEKKENPKHGDSTTTTTPLESNGQAVAGVEEEFPKPYSLDVTPEMQKFIAKKLSKALDEMIDEVMAEDCSLNQSKKKKENKSGILLCSSSQSVISARDIRRSQESSTNEVKRKKPQLLRRRHLDDGNGLDDDGDDEAKFRSVAVSAEWVKSRKY